MKLANILSLFNGEELKDATQIVSTKSKVQYFKMRKDSSKRVYDKVCEILDSCKGLFNTETYIEICRIIYENRISKKRIKGAWNGDPNSCLSLFKEEAEKWDKLYKEICDLKKNKFFGTIDSYYNISIAIDTLGIKRGDYIKILNPSLGYNNTVFLAKDPDLFPVSSTDIRLKTITKDGRVVYTLIGGEINLASENDISEFKIILGSRGYKIVDNELVKI